MNQIDICFNRHKGNASSIKANPKREAKAKFKAAILDILRRHPRSGKQIAELLNVQFNAISGRFSELKKEGLICGTGERVDGSEILRARVRL